MAKLATCQGDRPSAPAAGFRSRVSSVDLGRTPLHP